jgi:hypothetical protein
VTFINTSKKYEYLSNTIIGLFLLLLIGAALLTDIFRPPTKSRVEITGIVNLFNAEELRPITKISLKNKSGDYIFEKLEKNQISPWHMTSPRDVTANSIFIEKLFHSLTSIKVKSTFPNDRITSSNFSLDKPNATLTLEVKDSPKPIIVYIGLLNTIDNTTYVKISERNNIFQVEVPSVSLEDATILDLIESKIFSIDLESINSFKITFNKTGSPSINIHKQNSQWVDSNAHVLSVDKVEEYFQNLSVIKSSFVLDSQSDQQKKHISSLVRNPEITLVAEDNKKNIITYKISSLISTFPDIDLKNGPYFLVSISNNRTAYIVKREFLNLFNKNF